MCGRELCCASWLTDFRSVSTSAARYQQMSLNPQKLAGQCGKLKCCLNFELDQYVESVKEFPSPNAKIKMKEGRAVVFKMDIFKKLVYLLHLDAPAAGPVPVSLEDMKELMAMNERGEYPHSLSEFALQEEPDEVDAVYSNVVGQDSLTRFDEQRQKRRKKGGRPGSGGNSNRSGGRNNRGRSKDGPKAAAASPGGRSGDAKPASNAESGQNRGRGRSRGKGGPTPSSENNQKKEG